MIAYTLSVVAVFVGLVAFVLWARKRIIDNNKK